MPGDSTGNPFARRPANVPIFPIPMVNGSSMVAMPMGDGRLAVAMPTVEKMLPVAVDTGDHKGSVGTLRVAPTVVLDTIVEIAARTDATARPPANPNPRAFHHTAPNGKPTT
jgi:hypothetical protein